MNNEICTLTKTRLLCETEFFIFTKGFHVEYMLKWSKCSVNCNTMNFYKTGCAAVTHMDGGVHLNCTLSQSNFLHSVNEQNVPPGYLHISSIVNVRLTL